MIQTPVGFYGGEAFKMDTSTAANYYLKRQAQQQAKQAALDKYYKGLVANATDKGMRSQEQPAFQQALTNYKTFYTANSDKIASGLFPELALKAEQLARVPFEISSQSIQNYNRDKQVATIRMSNPEVADRWTQPTFDAYKKSTKPQYIIDPTTKNIVQNPDYSDFDAMSIVLNPKEVDLPKQWAEAGKDVEKVETTKDEPDDLDPRFYTKRTVTLTPTANGLAKVATNAASQWNHETEYTFGKDKTFAQFKLDSPDKFNELLASYQKVFPGKTMENDKDLYIATAINLADKTEVKPTQRIRDDVKWSAYQRAQNLAASKELSRYNHAMNAAEAQNEQNTHTFFEDIPAGTYNIEGGGTAVKKGDRWYTASGQPLTTAGDKPIKITGAAIPDGFTTGLPAKYKLAVDYIDLHVTNGVASGGYNEFTKLVPRSTAVKASLKGTKQKAAVVPLGGVVTDDGLGF